MSTQILEETNQVLEETKEIQQVARKSQRDWHKIMQLPWLWALGSILIMVGGFYLVLHPDIVVSAMNNPFSIGFILAIPVAFFLVKLIINFFSAIEQWIRVQLEKAKSDTRSYFFEVVTVVFMFVSISEGGPFFNKIQHNILGGALGYITVLAFDLVAVQCINARKKELARSGQKSGIYLLGIFICAAVSMTANLTTALTNYIAPTDIGWLGDIGPYIGAIFPIMIVILALTSDADIVIDDAEAYRTKQNKRVLFIRAQKEISASIAYELEQLDLLKKREFFLKSLLFTKKKTLYVIDVVFTKVQEKLDEHTKILRQDLDEKAKVINAQTTKINEQWEAMQVLATTIEETYGKQLTQALDQNRSLKRAVSEITLSVSDLTKKMEAIEHQRGEPFDAIGLYINDSIQVALEQFEDALQTSSLSSDTSASEATKKKKGSSFTEEEIAAMSAYPFFVSAIREGRRSLTISEIGNLCNLSPQMVAARVKDRSFLPTQKPGSYSIYSIGKWLREYRREYRPATKKNQIASDRNDQDIEQDTDQMAAIHGDEKLEELHPIEAEKGESNEISTDDLFI